MSGVSQVSPDSQESQGSPDLRGRSDPEERRAVMDLMDHQAQKELEGHLDYQDSQAHQVFLVCQGRMDLQAPEECRVATGQRVTGVFQDLEESLDNKEYQVHLVFQDQRETQVM